MNVSHPRSLSKITSIPNHLVCKSLRYTINKELKKKSSVLFIAHSSQTKNKFIINFKHFKNNVQSLIEIFRKYVKKKKIPTTFKNFHVIRKYSYLLAELEIKKEKKKKEEEDNKAEDKDICN